MALGFAILLVAYACKQIFEKMNCGENVFDSLILSPNGKCHYFRGSLPNFPSFQDANLVTNWNLRELLIRENENILNNPESFHSTSELCAAIGSIINKEKAVTTRVPKFYTTVFQELNEIGPEAEITSSFDNVVFRHTDPSGREHKSCVNLPAGYPDSPIVVIDYQLPLSSASNFETCYFSGIRNVKNYYQQLMNLIDVFQPFWDMLENFDANCCVIEPLKPLLSDCYRRIQLTETCTALLTFNPYNPSHRPDIELRGPDQQVNALRQTLSSHLMENHWDADVDVHLNLLSVLDLDHFVSQEAVDEFAMVQVGDCGICFEERLDGQAAVQRCDNPLCKSQYHRLCLLKYLSSALNSIRVMNTVMGRCPTCQYNIGCSEE